MCLTRVVLPNYKQVTIYPPGMPLIVVLFVLHEILYPETDAAHGKTHLITCL